MLRQKVARKFRRTNKKRDVNQLFRQTHGVVIASAVFEKLFSMICGYDEHSFIPALKLLQSGNQPGELLVHPVHSGIVERKDLLPVALQPASSNIKSIPECIEKSRPESGNIRHAEGGQRV